MNVTNTPRRARTSPRRSGFSAGNHLIAIAALGLPAAPAVAIPPGIFSIGDISGGPTESVGYALSADATTVVGYAGSGLGASAVRWREATGAVQLGSQAGFAYDASGDGATIVGRLVSATGGEEACYWRDALTQRLGFLSGGTSSVALGVSRDAAAIVGWSTSSSGIQAFRRMASGMQALGDLAGGTYFSSAVAASSNGGVVVGVSNSTAGNQAFRWTGAGGMVGLGFLSGCTESGATNVSASGQAVVGWSRGGTRSEAFLWTSGTMRGLGDLSGGAFQSIATAVSDDGNIVVGTAHTEQGSAAFLWTSADGMRPLRELLAASGVSQAAQWQLTSATDISADGQTFAGIGFDPGGRRVGWIARMGTGCAADWDQDGELTSDDFFAFLADFLAGDADFNGSGTVNSQDFFDYLRAYEVGCP
jgi:probable HAF family extracellular repeat protein